MWVLVCAWVLPVLCVSTSATGLEVHFSLSRVTVELVCCFLSTEDALASYIEVGESGAARVSPVALRRGHQRSGAGPGRSGALATPPNTPAQNTGLSAGEIEEIRRLAQKGEECVCVCVCVWWDQNLGSLHT